MRTLIAYSTIDGQTLQICRRLKEHFEQNGDVVELMEIGPATAGKVPGLERIVVGASVRYGKFREDVYRFIEANRDALENKPNAFFSVNLVARKAGRDSAETNPYVRVFRRNTQWVPKEIAVFAGKLEYRRYRFVDRYVIRLIMWLTDGPTHFDACVEYTDWSAVERFAQRVIALK